MEITEVRVKMIANGTDRLRAFCSITLDGVFVIRDIKVIDGSHGPFVAMPSRKLSDRCPRCGNKNHLRARYCNECGNKLNENRGPRDAEGRFKLHTDIAHPINSDCREMVQNAVIEAFLQEQSLSTQPGYTPKNEGGSQPVLHEDDGAAESEAILDEESVDDGGYVFDSEGNRGSREDLEEEKDGGSDYDQFIAELKETVEKKNHSPQQREKQAPPPESNEIDTDESDDFFPNLPEQEPKSDEKEFSPKNPPKAASEDDSFGAGIL